MTLLVILLSLLAPVLASVIFLPKTLRFLAELVGHHLRRSSRTRRELLLARVATESKNYVSEQSRNGKEDDDWEEIGNIAIGSAVNGGSAGSAGSEWNGIVGFFHPFWYG